MAIVVTRARGGARDQLRKYRVLVDGIEVGRVGQGETLSHEATEGEHTVQLKIDWGASAAYRFTLSSDESAYFACAPGGNAPLYAVTAGRDEYIELAPAAGPVEPWDVPGQLRSQRPVGLAVTFFGGGALLIGGVIWHLTGLAKKADAVVTITGFFLTLAAMIVFRLAERHANRNRQDNYNG
ncbi:MAG TPA: hypothetical protein VFU74_04940 [Actinocrinis sp.]|nr:hypothetical protein [Actinocrinis sp.]